MPANETSVPRLRPRSRSFRVFPGGTGVSSPASDRMRSELFTLINFRIGRSAKLWRRRAPSYYPYAQAEGLQEIFGKCVEHLWKLGRVARQFLRSGAPRT